MTATKSKYWAISTPSDGIIFEGTFTECWNQLVEKFHHLTMGQLEAAGVKIIRSK